MQGKDKWGEGASSVFNCFLYIPFFSCELDSRMALGAQWQCDGVSVSMTRTSNNASTINSKYIVNANY